MLTALSLTSSVFTAMVVFLALQSPNYFAGNYSLGAVLAVCLFLVTIFLLHGITLGHMSDDGCRPTLLPQNTICFAAT